MLNLVYGGWWQPKGQIPLSLFGFDWDWDLASGLSINTQTYCDAMVQEVSKIRVSVTRPRRA